MLKILADLAFENKNKYSKLFFIDYVMELPTVLCKDMKFAGYCFTPTANQTQMKLLVSLSLGRMVILWNLQFFSAMFSDVIYPKQ